MTPPILQPCPRTGKRPTLLTGQATQFVQCSVDGCPVCDAMPAYFDSPEAAATAWAEHLRKQKP